VSAEAATVPGAVPLRAPGVAAAARRAARARVLSVESEAERQLEYAEQRHRWRLYAVLAVVVLAAGGYHANRWMERRAGIAAAAARPTRAGAPADAVVSESSVRDAVTVIRSKDGRPFTAEELNRMESEESLRGNSVRAVGRSAVVIVPNTSGRPLGATAPQASPERSP
jgi:hypothetical protein